VTNLNEIIKSAIQNHLIDNSVESDKALIIGENIVADLSDQFGGQSYYLRNNSDTWRKQRQQNILSDLRGGMPKADVCQKHGITRTWLSKLEKRELSRMCIDKKRMTK